MKNLIVTILKVVGVILICPLTTGLGWIASNLLDIYNVFYSEHQKLVGNYIAYTLFGMLVIFCGMMAFAFIRSSFRKEETGIPPL